MKRAIVFAIWSGLAYSAEAPEKIHINVPLKGKSVWFTVYNTNDNTHSITQINSQVSQTHNELNNSPAAGWSLSGLLSGCWNRKWTIAGCAIPVAYIGMVGYTALVARKMYHADNWGCWKSDIPLAVLHEVAADEVSAELLKVLSARYNSDGRADLIDVFTSFKADCAAEVRQLATFLKMHQVCQKLNVSFLLPNHANEIVAAREQIERISFLTSLIKKNYAINRA